MRVATYTRISTDEAHQPYSLEAQATRLGSYIASQDDWSLVRQFSDQASGASTERPELTRALTEARAGRFDLLLVYRVDRFARSVRGLATLLEQLDSAGVAFRSATEPFDTATPAGRMMVQMLGVFAEFERSTIIDRVIAGMERKAARGEWCGGSRPYGYAIDPASGHLVPVETEEPVVKAIFDRYTRGRAGLKTVANWLNTRGHRTKSGRPWNHMAVLTVLRNRAYLGEVYFRDAYHPAPHRPLVDPDTFDLAQRILATRGEDYSHRAANASDYLLAGLLTCASCGKRFVGTAAHGNRYRYRYYTCFSRQRYGTDTCNAERLPADALDTAVLNALLDTYTRTDLFETALAAGAERAGAVRAQHQAELAVVDAEAARTEEAIERYLLAFEAGTLPEAQCGQRIRTLGAKAAELRTRRAELVDLIAAAKEPEAQRATLDAIRDHLAETIRSGEAATKKGLLQNLVHDIRVEGRHNIKPYFRLPIGPTTVTNPDPSTQGQKVRTPSGPVPPAGLEPATRCLEGVMRGIHGRPGPYLACPNRSGASPTTPPLRPRWLPLWLPPTRLPSRLKSSTPSRRLGASSPTRRATVAPRSGTPRPRSPTQGAILLRSPEGPALASADSWHCGPLFVS